MADFKFQVFIGIGFTEIGHGNDYFNYLRKIIFKWYQIFFKAGAKNDTIK